MTDPRYVNKLSEIYTEMYMPSGKERPLTEKHSCDEEHDYDIPKWKRLLNQHAQKEKFHRGLRVAYREPREDADESEENQDVGVDSEFVGKYLDALEKKNVLDDDDAHEVRKARKLIEHNIEGVMNYYKHLLQKIEQERSDQGALDALQQLKTHIQHQFNQYNQWGAPEDYDFKEL
jgi:hypothetical protein